MLQTNAFALPLSRSRCRALSLVREYVRVCVCGCEGSAVIVAAAAAAAQATSTPAARPSPVSRSVSFKSCHGQRCQPASVPFWLPSNVVVVRLKHASSTANNSSNIPQQQQYQQRAKSILTSRETNKKDHVKKYKLSKDFLKVTKWEIIKEEIQIKLFSIWMCINKVKTTRMNYSLKWTNKNTFWILNLYLKWATK